LEITLQGAELRFTYRAMIAAASLTLLHAGGVPLGHAYYGARQSSADTFVNQANQGANGDQGQANPPLTAPLEISVPMEPWAFRAGNKWNLVYELHIANIGNTACTLRQITVRGMGNGGKVRASLAGRNLEDAIAHPWVDEKTPANIDPAGIVVVFMWVALDESEDVPAALSHTVTMGLAGYHEDLSITIPALNVIRQPVPVIAPPLRGADWGAAHGPGNDSSHRRGLLPIGGRSYIAERYAIDWILITPSGDTHTGTGKANTDYPGYGADVLAAADGKVTEVTDNIPENDPGHSPAVPITLQTICGNHVIERMGPNLYASYCHLQPGIKVKAGSRVKRGQILGFVGNTGSSDAPHLHFQVCTANSTLACEGVPYAISSFVEERRSFNSPNGVKPQPDVVHSMEIPMDEMLVSFK
jgi:Peptidase family M23